MLAAVTWAALGAAAAVNVNVHVLLQRMGVLESRVLGAAVGDEPGHFPRLVGGEIDSHRLTAHRRIIVDPFFVGRHQFAVVPVGGRPVEHVLFTDELRVQRTFQHVHNPDLVG